MKVTGRGILRDASGEWLLIRPEPSNNPPNTLSRHDFFVARRYFIEKPEEGFLAGEDIFLAPHWKSIYGDAGFTIDWFSEVRECEITEFPIEHRAKGS